MHPKLLLTLLLSIVVPGFAAPVPVSRAANATAATDNLVTPLSAAQIQAYIP